MRTLLRFLLIAFCTVLALSAAAYGYFLHVPSPEAPRLGASLEYDRIQVGTRTRKYAFYAPPGLPPKAPLVLALHGSMGNAEQMRQATGYELERLADRHGFVVVYPEGYEGHWNDCRKNGPYAAKRLGVDDVGFLRALVAHFRSTRGVDSARVFAVGLSNGGHLSYRLALEAPDLVRAVAAVGASLPAPGNMDCTPTPGATSVLVMNGTADPINPYEGGKVTLFGFGDRGSVLSSRESAAYFVRRNGIGDPPTTEAIAQADDSGPTSAERTVWRSAARVDVRLYTIRHGGHTIPHPQVRSRRILGRTHRALNGPTEIWHFFARQGAREAR
jgi:polyhydroxybutyrate depolymerase